MSVRNQQTDLKMDTSKNKLEQTKARRKLSIVGDSINTRRVVSWTEQYAMFLFVQIHSKSNRILYLSFRASQVYNI